MRKKSYAEKLKDPQWQRKRLEIMERDNFTCRDCKAKTETLNVHHLFYERGKMPWEYANEHLVTVCEPCHELRELLARMILRMSGSSPRVQVQIIHLLCIIRSPEEVSPLLNANLHDAVNNLSSFLDALQALQQSVSLNDAGEIEADLEEANSALAHVVRGLSGALADFAKEVG